ncbi:hypothetical protein SIO70_11735 [Chitinophaga sancti]|uniref:hypothetical protein n=1 Tax=Chitinophaga sancti TaxID=1004 RepID=UPI002A75AD78|nr:hypothetical protein [Chitinophaga sancti]WPQ65519.1 hypothetical protein SIO70_11735 [Chitinophaga sancti]
MALTILSNPYKYTPSKNNIIWSVSSDASNIIYFTVVVYEAVSNNVISSLKIYPQPNNQTGAYIDLSLILRSYAKWEFKPIHVPALELVDNFEKNFFPYKIVVTEKLSSSGSIIDGASYMSDTCYVFNGKLDPITFKTYNQNKYVAQAGRIVNFLTSKPDNVKVNESSYESLHYLQPDSGLWCAGRYEFYDNNNNLLYTHYEGIDQGDERILYRLNCSLKHLKIAVTNVNFSNVAYYDVALVDYSQNPLTVNRRFVIESLPCHLEPVNLFFVNQFGVFETLQLFNPISTLSTTKQAVKNSPYKLNSEGRIADYDDKLFNIIDEILTVSPEQQIKLSTSILNDGMLKWLSNLLTSEQIIMQVLPDLYVPVLLSDSSYEMSNQKYQTEPNVKQFTFTLSDGFTPDFIFVNASNTLPAVVSTDGDFYTRNA